MRKKCNCKTAYAELKNSIYGTEIEDTNMKQVIGYIECDFMNIKSGMLYMLAIFGIASMAFAMKNGTGAVAYMLFCGLVMAGTAFNVTKQTVSFTALVPGSIWQKVVGRYLGGVLCIMLCAVVGIVSAGIIKLAGRANGMLEIPVLLCLLGVTFFFLALQNVLLYLLTPFLGIQVAGLVRMLPGFILYFAVMNAGNLETLTEILRKEDFSVRLILIVLGTGIASLIISGILSCLIIRNRDNE